MRFLVTGGSGFLGAAVCQQLLAGGDDVVVYDLAVGGALANALGEEHAREVTVRGDITDGLHLLRTARERDVDGIIHLASLLAVESDADPSLAVRLNSGGMVNVLETARTLGIKRVVWASSAAVYGGYTNGETVANDAAYTPQNIYAGTKVLNEVVAAHYTSAFGVDSIGLRFTLMTGVGKQGGLSGRIGTELIDKPVRGLPGRVPYGDDTPSWLWRADAARAVALAARVDSTKSRAFNITGQLRPIREAVEIVRTLLPGADVEALPGKINLYHVLDTTAIKEELGFEIEWTLEDQLREMVAQAGPSPVPVSAT